MCVCVCVCVCLQACIKSHRGKDFVVAMTFQSSAYINNFFFLLLCTNEWPPNVCAVIIMDLG